MEWRMKTEERRKRRRDVIVADVDVDVEKCLANIKTIDEKKNKKKLK